MKSFRLFCNAVKSTRHEMWVSIQILVGATLLLSLVLYFVEHQAQPEVFRTYWDALLWSFMDYIEDPGEFASNSPITFWGRILRVICALINIAIFAIPAGLIASGFSDAMAEEKREQELAEMQGCLSKSFRRKQDKVTKFRTVPRYVSLTDIQVMQQLDTKDIIDAVRMSDKFRMRNLASAIPASKNPTDRLVIEELPTEGQTSYGCCIDRGSKVTIVAPSAVQEVGMTNFAYYLALFGGFNYISKERNENADEPSSYYLIKEELLSSQYMADLQKLSGGSDRWTIALIVADSVYPEGLHFVTAKNEKQGGGSTAIEIDKLKELYQSIAKSMKTDFDIACEMDSRYLAAGSKNLAVRIGGGTDCNAFTIRIDWGIVAFDTRYIAIAYAMAKEIAKTLENKDVEPSPEWKQSGYGY